MKCACNKKLKVLLGASILTVGLAYVATSVVNESDSNKGAEVFAKVNGKKVYTSDAKDRLDAAFANIRTEQKVTIEKLPKQALEALAKDIAISKEVDRRVKKSGVLKDEELKKAVEEYEMSMARDKFMEEIIEEKVGDSAIKARYEQIAKELDGQEEVRVKHILLDNEDEAKKILRSVKLNQSRSDYFENMAKRKSLDKNSAEKGGDLGFVMRSQVVEEFAEVAFMLKEGAIAKKPVKTQFGWHVIKVIERRPAKPAPYEQVKEQIRQRMSMEAIQDYYNSIADELEVELVYQPKVQAQKAPIPAEKPAQEAEAK